MIYSLTDFICLDISILLMFLIFCLSDFIDNCKSPVHIISKTNLSVYNNKVSSQYSPDRNSPSFRTHAWDDLCWSVGRKHSQNWVRRLVLSFGIVFLLGIEWLLRLLLLSQDQHGIFALHNSASELGSFVQALEWIEQCMQPSQWWFARLSCHL